MDLKGDHHIFFAMALEDVMGDMGCSLNAIQLKLMFPDSTGVPRMRVNKRKVNYQIGIKQASWQPERKTRAIYGGDFWIWSNR